MAFKPYISVGEGIKLLESIVAQVGLLSREPDWKRKQAIAHNHRHEHQKSSPLPVQVQSVGERSAFC